MDGKLCDIHDRSNFQINTQENHYKCLLDSGFSSEIEIARRKASTNCSVVSAEGVLLICTSCLISGVVRVSCVSDIILIIIITIIIIIIIIILSFDIAPFPYKHAQRRITFHCQRIDVDIHIVN